MVVWERGDQALRPGLDTEGSAIHQGDAVSRPGLNGYVQTGSPAYGTICKREADEERLHEMPWNERAA